jgi:hypothetical protein
MGGSDRGLWSNRYVAGTGWGTAAPVEDDGRDHDVPQVAFDARGQALAVWGYVDGANYHTWAGRFVPGSGWGTPVPIFSEGVGDAYSAKVAFAADGTGLSVWLQSDGSRVSVWAGRFFEDIAPPVAISSPSDGLTTEAHEVTVRISSDPGATVSVNGAIAEEIGSYGSGNQITATFSVVIQLAVGANTLVATATDAAGNTASTSVQVTVADRGPALAAALNQSQAASASGEAQIAARHASIDLQQAANNASAENLSAAQAAATAAQGQAAAAAALAAPLEASLAASNASLSAATARLAALHAASGNNTNTTGGATQGDIDAANSSAFMWLLVGVAGIAVGVAGVAVGALKRRGR